MLHKLFGIAGVYLIIFVVIAVAAFAAVFAFKLTELLIERRRLRRQAQVSEAHATLMADDIIRLLDEMAVCLGYPDSRAVNIRVKKIDFDTMLYKRGLFDVCTSLRSRYVQLRYLMHRDPRLRWMREDHGDGFFLWRPVEDTTFLVYDPILYGWDPLNKMMRRQPPTPHIPRIKFNGDAPCSPTKNI